MKGTISICPLWKILLSMLNVKTPFRLCFNLILLSSLLFYHHNSAASRVKVSSGYMGTAESQISVRNHTVQSGPSLFATDSLDVVDNINGQQDSLADRILTLLVACDVKTHFGLTQPLYMSQRHILA